MINLIVFIHLGSLERLQRHSASFSSDDVVGLSQESSTLSQSSVLPRSSTLPYEATPQSRSTPCATCPRPRSPGSEMVTLEEFLQESNTLSPPTVRPHRKTSVYLSEIFVSSFFFTSLITLLSFSHFVCIYINDFSILFIYTEERSRIHVTLNVKVTYIKIGCQTDSCCCQVFVAYRMKCVHFMAPLMLKLIYTANVH